MYNKSTSIKSYRLLVAVLRLLLVFQDSLSRHLPHWPCAQPFYTKGVTVESLDLHVMICFIQSICIWLRKSHNQIIKPLIFLNISILFKIPAPKALSPIGTPPLRPDQQWGPPTKSRFFFTFGALENWGRKTYFLWWNPHENSGKSLQNTHKNKHVEILDVSMAPFADSFGVK